MFLFFFCRCFVPECENKSNGTYKQPWLEAAIPPASNQNGKYVPSQCLRYDPKNISQFLCIKSDFTKETITCDTWLFEDDEWTIVGEVKS